MSRLRIAGHGRDRLGREVTWTIADGERGRRWREVATDAGGAVAQAITLETGHAGQWLRLEIAAPAGLLSLHPDRDGAIHGNVVTGDGVRHIALEVMEPPLLDLRDALLGETALCRALERIVPAGQGTRLTVVRVTPSLEVATVELEVGRRSARRWELDDAEGRREVEMGDLGTPVEGETAVRWPLETGS